MGTRNRSFPQVGLAFVRGECKYNILENEPLIVVAVGFLNSVTLHLRKDQVAPCLEPQYNPYISVRIHALNLNVIHISPYAS